VQNTEKQIEKKIKDGKRGKFFFHDNFATLGTPNAIRQALQRLQKSGLIMRVAHGIYYYPKISTSEYFKGEYLPPSIDDIAHAIAKRDKTRIVPTASHALNALGLSTQVPMNVVYITDGAPRRIKVGNRRGILFKHTSETKNLAYKSKLLMLIVSALREIGEGKVTPQQLEIIKSHMANISQKELNTDIELMPQWVRKILLSL
jgi:predicted transcriptional regulator of viral defense system